MALPETISVEDFFSSPVRAGASISPDGTKIAYLAPWKNRLNIWVQSIDAESDDARRVTAEEHRSVQSFSWTDDPRWLLYQQDNGGDELFHIYRVDLDDPDTAVVDLTPFPGARADFDLPGGSAGKAHVTVNNRRPDLADFHELDIATGELTLIAENPGHVAAWLSSGNGEVFTMSITIEGDIELAQWDSTSKTTRLIKRYDGDDYTLGVYPISITPDGTGFWLGSNTGSDRLRVVRLDAATGEEIAVDSHPTFDVDRRVGGWPPLPSPLILSSATGELIGVRYLGERQEIRTLDPQFAGVLEKLEKLSDGDIGAIGSDKEGRRWVVSFTHDREPDLTYLYDDATGESRLLFRPYPRLSPETLAPMTPVTIPSRDGLDLHSYLTLPVGIEPTNLPMVLLVHGGPWYRDSWSYQPNVQMLANRGYAVLQVNFRGSIGYGKAFVKAAVGEFAGKMHDDLIDGVNWAVQQGYADPERVAIFGGSYGGYATLVGVTFTPDVFAAAIDYVGISDLSNFMRTLPEIARPHLANNWHRFVGNPDIPEELEDMLARSPITKVDQVRTPLLVVQGANDKRVVQAESDNMVKALRARGVEVEYLVKADEGHGFVNPDNRIDFFHTVEKFLAKHLGGRA